MKFTTDKNVTYRPGVGYVQRPWIDYGLDPEKSILKYAYERVVVYDADCCGDKTVVFTFHDGSIWVLEYSWWFEWHHENEDENGFHDEIEYRKLSPEEAPTPVKERDWL